MQILNKRFALFFSIVAAIFVLASPASGNAQSTSHSVNFTDNFSSGSLDQWQFRYPGDWAIQKKGSLSYLHMLRSREAEEPRHPIQFALLKGINVGNFTFQARVRRYHKSVMLVFDYVDPLHFYYTHLSVDTGAKEPVHNGIFIVDGGPRRRIAGLDANSALPDMNWHTVRVERNVHSGSIKIFVDNAHTPLFSVVDRTFTCGRVGVGSFDETGDFTDIKLVSHDPACTPSGGNMTASKQ